MDLISPRRPQDPPWRSRTAHRTSSVQAMEALLECQAQGQPGGLVEVNGAKGGLVLMTPGKSEAVVLYAGKV